jgi:tetratricopeptide (TPR) repeat protein
VLLFSQQTLKTLGEQEMNIKKIISKILLPGVLLIIGIFLGSGLTLYGVNKYWLYYIGLLPVKFVVWESEEAYVPYSAGKSEVAEYALEHNARVLEYFSKVKDVDSWGASTDLAFTYMRLGKLAELKGDKEKATAYFQRGLDQYNKNKKDKCPPEKLRSLIDKLDSKKPEKSFGSFEAIFDTRKKTPNQEAADGLR